MATEKGKAKAQTEEFAPSEEQILKELKQKEQRKKYMTSDKAKAQRKSYMQKRYDQAKNMREFMKNHPEEIEAIKAKHGL